MFAFLKKYFSFLFLLYFLALPSFANAGVLIRSISSRGNSYTPRRSTDAIRRTNPNLNYRGRTVQSQINYLEKLQTNYDKELAKWYKQKAKVEEKIAKERNKREEQERKLALKAQKSFESYSSRNSSDSRNPISWFKKRIAGVKEDSKSNIERPKIEFNNTARSKLSEDKDLALNADKSPKKKEGFWKRILQALGIA